MVTIGTLINDIRERTEMSIVSMRSPGQVEQHPYSQLDLEFQVKSIMEMIKTVNIEPATAPVMSVVGLEQPIVMQSRRLEETEMVTIPKGCDTIFIYTWFTMIDLMTQVKCQMIRLAFTGEGKQL
jgi:hypothetical protein